jgi:alpha-2-macroglobulin-like protein
MTEESGTIRVYLNDRLVATRMYEANEMEPIKISGLEAFMKPGKQDFKVLFVDTETALPFTLNAGWTSYTPNSNADCSVRLKTTLATEKAKINETVRMSIGLSNITSKNIPMTLAIVGIPSGLSLQPWQLKELQEKRVFDFYEIWGSYLVIYYRAMVANETKTIHLDLKAEVPGIYEAPASSAFLYYTNEYKHWVNGQRVTIE